MDAMGADTSPGQKMVEVAHRPDGRRHVRILVSDPDETGIGERDGREIERGCRLALDQQLPIVLEFAANGPNPFDGLATTFALGGAARALTACSGRVPTLGLLDGDAVAGPSLLLGLLDFVVVVDGSHAFVSGPSMVHEFTGVEFDRTELGGDGVLSSHAGLATLRASSHEKADDLIGDLLDLLPSNKDQLCPLVGTTDAVDRDVSHVADIIPEAATGAYDVRNVVTTLADDEWFLECRPSMAPNLVTGFASFGGIVSGIVANQPMAIAGTLDIPSSQKGGRFVAFCDAFNIPLVTFVDTSGFYPGKDLEWRGMIRYGAQLAFAYARSTVPRINITLRKSYGGAYIVMDSKNMGNDLAFAWPSAEIAVMGAKGAVEILHRGIDEEQRQELEDAYEARLLNPYIAAQRGSVDAVISPGATRFEVASSLRLLLTKQEKTPRRRHDNTPL